MHEKPNAPEQAVEAAPKPYGAPTLLSLGTLRELTQAGGPGLIDGGIFS